MTPTHTQILQVIRETFLDEAIPIPPDPTAFLRLPLAGAGSRLRSIDLVAILVGIEERLHARHAISIDLIGSPALIESPAHLASIDAFAQFLHTHLTSSP